MDSKENIQFLIDYENVQEAGLDGAECLCYADTLAIFYSAVCDKIPRRFMNRILESGCEFQAYKLKKDGKNALDFYIVSRVGALFGAGFAGKIVVVSKDKGYSAMKDFWMGRGIGENRILLKHTIRDGILATNENSIRRKQIARENERVSIGQEFAKYQERAKMKKKMEALFAGTEYEAMVARICELTEEEKTPKDLYIGSLKKFGREDGTKIYRYLRQVDGRMPGEKSAGRILECGESLGARLVAEGSEELRLVSENPEGMRLVSEEPEKMRMAGKKPEDEQSMHETTADENRVNSRTAIEPSGGFEQANAA